MNGDHVTALITKHEKKIFKNCTGEMTGVNAKNENKINAPDIRKDIMEVTSRISRQNLGVSLNAIGWYLNTCTIISTSHSKPKTIAGINNNHRKTPSYI